jgi:hypothetical protein
MHVRKSKPHRDRNLLGKSSIILSLKLVSMPHSCPHMTDHCDVITPPRAQHALLAADMLYYRQTADVGAMQSCHLRSTKVLTLLK